MEMDIFYFQAATSEIIKIFYFIKTDSLRLIFEITLNVPLAIYYTAT